jgi:hypothetical protein
MEVGKILSSGLHSGGSLECCVWLDIIREQCWTVSAVVGRRARYGIHCECVSVHENKKAQCLSLLVVMHGIIAQNAYCLAGTYHDMFQK